MRRSPEKILINSKDRRKISFEKTMDSEDQEGEEASRFHTLASPSTEYLSDEINEEREPERVEHKRVNVAFEDDLDDEIDPEEIEGYKARRKSAKKKNSIYEPSELSASSLTNTESSFVSGRGSRAHSEVEAGHERRKSSMAREKGRSKLVKVDFVESMKKKMALIKASISRSEMSDADIKISTSTSDIRDRTAVTSTLSSTSTARTRLRKKRKKKFNRRKFLKKMVKLDRKIKAAEKLKNKTIISKKDTYEKWNNVIEKFLIAKKQNDNLKNKVRSLHAMDKTGLWETTRRIRNEIALQANNRMRTLGGVYTHALAGALKDMDKHNYALFKKIINSDRSRLRIREEMELFLNRFWKQQNEKENLYIKQFNSFLDAKDRHLDTSFKQKLKKLSEKFTNEFKSSMQLNDTRLQKVFNENYKKIEKCLQVYSGITENNFFFIKELSVKINGLKWKEIVTRNNLDKLIKQKTDMTERFNSLQEINMELSREVATGKLVRRELLHEIKRKKSLEFETDVANINYEFREHENKETTETLAKTRENLKKHLVKQKKEFFKTWILQSTKIREQVLYEHYFKEVIESLGDDTVQYEPNTLSPNEELFVPYEGLRVTLGDFETIPIEKTENEYQEYRKSFNTVIKYYKKHIGPKCNRIENLSFLLKDRLSHKAQNYADQERDVINKIKKDLRIQSASTDIPSQSWSIKSISYN